MRLSELFFHSDDGFCLGSDICRGKSVYFEKRRNLSGAAVHILDADAQHRHRTKSGKRLADRASESADDVMLLRRHDSPRLGGRSRDKLRIERLDRVNVDDLGGNAVRRRS